MQIKQFTSKQIEKLTGLKIRTSHYYVEAGIFTPDVQGATGTGTIRYFSAINLMEAEIISQFIGFGFPKRLIASFFASIKKSNDRPKLDPYKILKYHGMTYRGNTTLFFFPNFDDNTAYHSIIGPPKLTGRIDFNDYERFPIKIEINLMILAKRLIEKLKELDL